ncbi:MAG: DUF4956 domain-containing protein [Lachnospiraceae bacterium]|jgi:hypothetical protein|nr:DUF4956 domain-containing protein [Lachnospiraceae bacterium]MCI1328412.1 DUF4956 domain-containing protein [Lachnospiraceae bacterium]
MMENLFTSVITNGALTGAAFLACTAGSLLLGALIAFLYLLTERTSRSFLITLIILPAVIQMIIMLVNGNIGAGVAVAGAFSLVRFRSVPGNGKEISTIFLTMAVGLATGMGYIAVAVVFAVTISLISFLISKLHLGSDSGTERILRITIPEDLDYEGVFEDVLAQYTARYELLSVRTAGMGTLYKLEYRVLSKRDGSSHEMIDRLRERNGNLEIFYGRPVTSETAGL